MYQPPQPTFFYEDTPPTSPQNKPLPTFHISPASHDDKAQKRRQREEKSRLKHPPPFSYEYVVRDGKLAGLAEYNPDNDYLHYSSSSRGSSRVPSRNTSTNPSPRTSTVERQSEEADRTMPPPPSPKKTDKLKRALSFGHLKDKKRRAPPLPASPRISTAAFAATENHSPTPMLEPSGPTSPRSPRKSFEEPRAAPQPPSRNPSDATRQTTPPLSPKQSSEESRSESRKPNGTEEKKGVLGAGKVEKSFEGPKRRPTIITSDLEQKPIAVSREQSTAPRPPLRRKTSKFIEHIDTAPPEEQRNSGMPPVPTLPPFDFQFPTAPTPSRMISRSVSNVKAPVGTVTHLEWAKATRGHESKPQSKPQRPRPIFLSTTKSQPIQPQQNKIARMLSTSNVKPGPTRVPIPATVLKRSMSTQTRPPNMWADICMAEVKPILMGPIVATGHARMVSC